MMNISEFRGYRTRVEYDRVTRRFSYQREAEPVIGEPDADCAVRAEEPPADRRVRVETVHDAALTRLNI